MLIHRIARSARIAALVFALSAAASISFRAQAQTAHFLGAAPVTLPSGSGFSGPLGVAVDQNGNVFVADSGDSAVKEIPLINGSYGAPVTLPSGSGFNNPFAVAVDASGDVFVADAYNNAVKEIPFSGGSYGAPVTLPSGNGFSQPQGIAVDANGNVYVADSGNQAVKKIPWSGGGYGTPAGIGGTFSNPVGVAVDANGNVDVADAGSGAVKQIPLSGGLYGATVTLSSGFSELESVAVDGSGNLFVATSGGNAIDELLYNGSTYGAPVILGYGLRFPASVAVDARGKIFVADSGNNAVKEISPAVDFGSVAVNTSTPAPQTLTFRIDSVTGGDTLGAPYVLTQGATGLDYNDAGTGTCTSNGSNHSYSPGDTCTVVVHFEPKHAGARYGAVQLVSTSGSVLATAYLYGTGAGPQVAFLPAVQSTVAGGFNYPEGVAVDGNGNVFVADTLNSVVREIPWNGIGYGTVASLPSGTGLVYFVGIAVDGSGNVFIADSYLYTVLEIPFSAGSYGQPITLPSGSGFNLTQGIAVDGSGNVFVADYNNLAVKEIPFSGGNYGEPITLPRGSGFGAPVGVAVDAGGDVFACDVNNIVEEIPFSGGGYGAPLTVLSGQTYALGGIAVDGTGNLFIGDSTYGTVKEIPLIAGSYGAPVTIGSGFVPEVFYYTSLGVAVDGSGNVYVTNTGDNSIAKLDLADAPSLNFPTPTRIGQSDATDDPQSFSIWNIGNENLTFHAAIPIELPSTTTSFGLDGATTCGLPGTLAPGASCSFAVDFEPLAIGALSGSVLLTDNASSAAATIHLSGAGVAKPPAIFASFSLSTIDAGGTSTLTFDLKNPSANPVALTGVSFSAGLPAGLVAATPSGLNNTCGGVALLEGATVVLEDGTIQSQSSCTVTVNVTSTSAAAYTVTTGPVSSTNGGTNNGTGGAATATLTVLAPIGITPVTLVPGTVSGNYSVHFAAVGGTPHYTWSITSGTPPGMGMDANGYLSGRPTTSGTFHFTISVSSSKGGSGSQAYTLVVNKK